MKSQNNIQTSVYLGIATPAHVLDQSTAVQSAIMIAVKLYKQLKVIHSEWKPGGGNVKQYPLPKQNVVTESSIVITNSTEEIH